jgi:hypothetical protein
MPVVWLICDISGSMVEAGKRFQARSMIREIEQLSRFGYIPDVDIRLATWGQEVIPCTWGTDEEVPDQVLNCREASEMVSLAGFITERQDDRHIILSDCHWSLDSEDASIAAKLVSESESVRIIGLGADANMKVMNRAVIPCEESIVFIEEWLSS